MLNVKDKNKCSGCKACYNICPKNGIKMVTDEEGFWYPKVNEDICIQCGLCEKVCPEINVYNNDKSYDKPMVLAAWNKDKDKRIASSSGGIFLSIGEWIISQDGVVFGAGYDNNFQVIHKEVRSLEELDELKGSKYVQSDINDSYMKTKANLGNNKKVLFVGTPCQIAGLYNYLQKDYNNLFTCDLVCHGVPSPEVFKRYIGWLEKIYGSRIKRIAFRHKKYGWKLYSVSFQFENDTEYSKILKEDPYLLGFLRDYYLRPSCYTCIYAKLPRISDITLGDFWGVANRYPELDDDKGTSLLLINSNKGKCLLENCKDSIYIFHCDLEHAIRGNPCIVKPVNRPKLREKFFEDFGNKDFEYVMKKYLNPPSWIERQIIVIRKVFGFIRRKIMRHFQISKDNN